jgi:hypothetical protein
LCRFYQVEENTDHLFFSCPNAVFVWAVLQDGLGQSDVLKSLWDFKENYIGNRGVGEWGLYGSYLMVFAGRYGLTAMILFLTTR